MGDTSSGHRHISRSARSTVARRGKTGGASRTRLTVCYGTHRHAARSSSRPLTRACLLHVAMNIPGRDDETQDREWNAEFLRRAATLPHTSITGNRRTCTRQIVEWRTYTRTGSAKHYGDRTWSDDCARRRKPRLSPGDSPDWRAISATYATRLPHDADAHPRGRSACFRVVSTSATSYQ